MSVMNNQTANLILTDTFLMIMFKYHKRSNELNKT